MMDALFIADIVLAADARVSTSCAEERLFRLDGKLAALDAVDGCDEPRGAIGQRLWQRRRSSEGNERVSSP